jgi:O-antigen/teichoic acid export membrane protein
MNRFELMIGTHLPTAKYLFYSYLGKGISIISGVFLARKLGVVDRGMLTYYANFILLACFVTATNISSGTARIMNSDSRGKNISGRNEFSRFLAYGLSFSFLITVIIGIVLSETKSINRTFFLFLIFTSGLSAFNSYFDGIWKYQNNISLLTLTRFLGIAAPAVFALSLIITDKAQITYLLLSQTIVLLLNILVIIRFLSKRNTVGYPKFLNVIKSSIFGFPTYLAEYLCGWIIPFMILYSDGQIALGNFAIASSYAALADVVFGAIEAKNYKPMVDFYLRYRSTPKKILLSSVSPLIILHLIFIPMTFVIPLVYGSQFQFATIFSICFLLMRIPIVIARTIAYYLVSIGNNHSPIYIYLSFLLAFIITTLLSNLTLIGFHWIFSYLFSAGIMLLTSILVLGLSSKNIRGFSSRSFK